MKILAYVEGGLPDDDVAARADTFRARGHAYHYRDVARFGIVERCDAIETDDEHVLAAYRAVGIGPLGEDVDDPVPALEPLMQLETDPDVAPTPPSPPEDFAIPTLEHDDAALKAYLVGIDAAARDAFFEKSSDEALADYLVKRAGKTRKDGWTTGTMGNMIERHLEL